MTTKKQPIKSFKEMRIHTEMDLHVSVINFIRSMFPKATIRGSLGDTLNTDEKRLAAYAKGFARGEPDLQIFTKHPKYSGFAIEFKTPKGTGAATIDQLEYLDDLKANGWKTLISDCYNEIVVEITKYLNGI